MPSYEYIVKTQDSRTIKDAVEAATKAEVIGQLRSKGYYIISVKEAGKSISSKAEKHPQSRDIKKKKRRGVKSIDLCFFARNLSIVLSAGVPLLRSLELVASQTESYKLAQCLFSISSDVRKGLSFSEALARHKNVFSSLWRGIVEVGEASGNLPFVLERLADYLEREQEFIRKIKGAMTYPVVVFVFSGIVVLVFFKFILPKFTTVFESFGMKLPFITQVLFDLSQAVNEHFIFIILAIIAFIALIVSVRKNVFIKSISDKVVLKVPILKDLLFMMSLERFSSTMYILMESGVPIVYSLEIVARSLSNSQISRHVAMAKDNVKTGKNLSSEIAKIKYFPALMSEIVRIGEEAGNMPQMFEKISHHYQKELESNLDRLVAIFEPLMIFFLGILITIIVVALFMPIFQMSTLGGAKV